MTQKLTREVWTFLLAWLALGLLMPRPVVAQTPPDAQVSLTPLTFYVTGLNLRPSPDRQAVSKDITTIVNTELRFGTDAMNFADVRAAT